jgi:hypothetical protein
MRTLTGTPIKEAPHSTDNDLERTQVQDLREGDLARQYLPQASSPGTSAGNQSGDTEPILIRLSIVRMC